MREYFRLSASSKAKIYAPKILNDEVFFEQCNRCGSVYLKKEIGDVSIVLEGKGKYPDILVCGSYPILIVSDKVIKIWEQNNIIGYNKYKVKLYKSDGEEISNNEIVYHHVIITSCCNLDLDAMDINVTEQCDVCGKTKYNKETWEFGTPKVKNIPDNKSDLFVFKEFRYSVLCSKKVLETIYKNKLTNFNISKMEDMFDYCTDEIDLKELF